MSKPKKFTAYVNGRPFRGTIHQMAAQMPGAVVSGPSTITLGPPVVTRCSLTWTGRARLRDERCPTCQAKIGERCKGTRPGEAHFITTIPIEAQPLSVGALKAGSR